MFKIFLILLIFSSFWLPYCYINFPNFLIHNSSFSLFIFCQFFSISAQFYIQKCWALWDLERPQIPIA